MNISRTTSWFVVPLGVLTGLVSPSSGAEDPAWATRVDAHLSAARQDLIEFRHDLHRHPELAGEEVRTARLVAQRLEAHGLTVRTGVGGHGVVAVLRGAKPGPVVAYRADMDAIPFDAPDPAVAIRSEVPGVRHACGHDVHVAVGLGVVAALAPMREDLTGTVVFLFQPAEETATGARAMIEAGALSDPAPEAIFALHCSPLPLGSIGVRDGVVLPGFVQVRIELSGDGDLEAAARECAAIVARAGTVSPANMGAAIPEDFVATGIFPPGHHADIADEDGLTLVGMIRAATDEGFNRGRDAIIEGLGRASWEGVELTHGFKRMIPATDNDADVMRRARVPLRVALGAAGLVEIPAPTPFFSEDFAFFQEQIPGIMVFLGVSDAERGIVGLPHSPGFAAADEAIEVGARAMAHVLLDALERDA